MEEKKEAQLTVEKEESNDTANQIDPKNILFGSISYADEEAYEKFISEMNISQALFVLIASANFAQAKGSFNLLESESLSTAIRTIRKTSESQKTNNEN